MVTQVKDISDSGAYRPFGLYRTILALLVIPQHIGSPYLTGTAAVYTFFALSGFVIMEAADRFYTGRPLSFVINRALRIVPPFLVALAISILAYLLSDTPADLSAINVIRNIFGLLPLIEPTQSFLPYAWAIEVELYFYAVIAASLMVRVPIMGLIAVFGFLSFAIIGRPNLFVYIPFFAYGVLCYKQKWFYASIAFFCSIYVAPELFKGNGPFLTTSGVWEHVAFLTILLIAIPILARVKIKRNIARTDQQFGALSFPIYLLQHAAIIISAPLALYGYRNAALVYSITLIMAFCLDRALERPLSVLRQAVRGKKVE